MSLWVWVWIWIAWLSLGVVGGMIVGATAVRIRNWVERRKRP